MSDNRNVLHSLTANLTGAMAASSRSIGRALIAIPLVSAGFVALNSIEAQPVQAAGECPAGWVYSSAQHACSFTVSSTTSLVTVTIPAGVTEVHISATGAKGGNGGGDNQFNSNGGAPGVVGRVTGSMPITPGSSISVAVGAVGSNGSTGCDGGLGGCTSGYGNGGSGAANSQYFYPGGTGASQAPNRNSGGGGGGGAATVVNIGSVQIIAAGGGGGGGGGSGGRGGSSTSTPTSFTGTTAGGNGSNNGSDGGGGGGGGGGYRGGLGGTAPAGDYGGYGGQAGQNLTPTGFSGSYVSATSGSAVISYALAPLNTTVPTVPTNIFTSQSAGGVEGTWNGAQTLSYQWLTCTASAVSSTSAGSLVTPDDCTPIDGATSQQYTPKLDDLGNFLRLAVTATNSAGSTTSLSATSSPVALSTPVIDLETGSDSAGVSDSDNLTNDTTPTYTATNVTVGAEVLFTAVRGAETISCGPVAVSGATASCNFPELINGSWNVTAQQIFSTFNSAVSNTVTTIIDATAPNAPSDIRLASTSDLGVLDQDSITKDSTPTLELEGLEVGARVVVTASKPGTTSVTCVIENVASTNESCTFGTVLSDGEWTFSAVQVDDAGNGSAASPSITATIDTSAGVTLSSTTAATGTSATAEKSFTFTARLTDVPDNGTGFTASDVTLGGTSTGWSVGSVTRISDTEYRFTVSATSPTQGTLSVQTSAGSYEDSAGNTALVSNQWLSTIVVDEPMNTAVPVITATKGTTTTLGSTLSTSNGTWNDKGDINPASSYQWQACTDPADATTCTDITGATSQTYVPTADREGKYIRSVVTRTNVAGGSSQASTPVGPMVKSAQQINFTDPADRTFSPTPFTIAPTSTFPGSTTTLTGLTVSVTSLTPNVCTVTGLSVTMLKAGTCSLAADQVGSAEFEAATRVTQSFNIAEATESPVTVASVSRIQPGENVDLSTNNQSQGAVTYTVVSGPCRVEGTKVTSTGGAGDCVIKTDIAGDGRYRASTPPNITIPIRITETITLPQVDDSLRSAGAVTFPWTSVSGRVPTLVSSDTSVCTITESAGVVTVTPVGTGMCTVSGSLLDDGIHSSAVASMSFEFVDRPAAPTINSVSVSGADDVSGGTALVAFTPGALNNSTLVNYTVQATPVGGGAPITNTCTATPCTVAGLNAGTAYTFTVITNATGAGTTLTSLPSSASTQVTVKAPHPITLSDPGRKLPGDAPFTVTALSGADPSWIPTISSLTPSVCTVSGTTVTIVGPGTCTLKASHVGGTSGGVDYGYGSATMSFRVGTDPIVVATDQKDSALTHCQLAALHSKGLATCPFANPLPGADQGDDTVGIGGGNGAGSTDGLKPPPPPLKTQIVRLDNGRQAKVTVTVRQDKPGAPVRSVVFVVFDEGGTVVARIAVEVPEGQTTVVATVPYLRDGYQIRTYTTNEAGVSNKAPIGANVLNQPTVLGKKKDGTPILFGKKIARPVLFDPDSPQLDKKAREVLDSVVKYAAKNGGRVFITGFVRNQGGSVKDQKELSDARAEQVAIYLSERGVDTWIRYDGYGAYRKGQGIPRDRRVEVRWSNGEIPGLEATKANPVYFPEQTASAP